MSYYLLRLFLKLISYIPFKMMYVISSGLYFILYYVVGYRKKIVRKNLTECFPEKSPQEITRIEKGFYRNFADNLLETCKTGSMSDEEISRRMKFINLDEAKEVLSSGKPIALYIGHYGNWEWVSSMPLHLDDDTLAVQIYHRLRNKNIDKLMLESRSAHGAVSVEMYQTARFIKKLSMENKVSIIGFIADQSPKYREVHDFVPFMNHDTPALTGTEKIAKHFGFEAWFLDIKKPRRGYYEAELIRMHDNPKSLPDFKLTEIYYRHLEEIIRRNPELYLWSHNRFKYAKVLNENNVSQNGN